MRVHAHTPIKIKEGLKKNLRLVEICFSSSFTEVCLSVGSASASYFGKRFSSGVCHVNNQSHQTILNPVVDSYNVEFNALVF